MTPQAPLLGAVEGERIDVPEAHELALISRKDMDEGSGLREWSVEPPHPLQTAETPLALSLPAPRCARTIGPQPTRRHCNWTARGPPALAA